jgi:prolyl-tRNA synthetase
VVGTIVEACHDDRGIVWPRRVAPYQVEIVSLRSKDEAMQTRISETALALYEDLTKQGVEVLWDDRADVSPGEKFADADLLGMPLRLVVSEKMLKENSIEWKERAKTEAQVVKMEDVVEMVGEFVK